MSADYNNNKDENGGSNKNIRTDSKNSKKEQSPHQMILGGYGNKQNAGN